MASKQTQDLEGIDDQLDELEINLKRLRIDYEQYFKGSMKREPYQLLTKVQKTITRFASDPPRRVVQKFKYNSLVARFQTFRQLWGRTQRELDSGKHKSQAFRQQHSESVEEPAAKPSAKKAAKGGKSSPLDKLTNALMDAKRKSGEDTRGVSKEKIAAMVQKQKKAIAEKYGKDAKVAFRVVVEDGKAKVKASVKRSRAS